MTSGASAHYPTMSIAEIKALPVWELIDRKRGTVLFLWATVPMLPDAVDVMRVWGFSYKTMLVWHKTGRLGLGYWFRGNAEVCLVGVTKGVKAFRCQESNIIAAPVTRHSSKPQAFFDLVEPICDRCDLTPRLELFAREQRDGWDAWGDEVA